MQARQVTIGGVYIVKVSGRESRVRIERECRSGGWYGTNLRTGREVRIRTAGRLRRPADDTATAYAEEHPAKQYKRKPRPPQARPIGTDDGWLELDGTNKICEAIRETRHQIHNRQIDPQRLELHRRQLDLCFPEFIRFQELKSLGIIRKQLTHDEARTVYNLLGESPEHFNRQDFATKWVLTNLLQELLTTEVKRRTS